MRGSLLSQKHFFSDGIKKLVLRWKKCIEKQGDYVEKWCYYKFYIFIEIKFVSVVRIIVDSLTYIHMHFPKFRYSVQCISTVQLHLPFILGSKFVKLSNILVLAVNICGI